MTTGEATTMSWSDRDWIKRVWLRMHPEHKGKLPTLKAMWHEYLQALEELREREDRERRERWEQIEQDCKRIQEAYDDTLRYMCRLGLEDAYNELLKLLELTPPATHEQIKAAYYKLAKTHHPDVGGNDAAFRRIETAYRAVLEATDRYGLLDR
jgi:hypothetical protein